MGSNGSCRVEKVSDSMFLVGAGVLSNVEFLWIWFLSNFVVVGDT